jgi:glucokinase
VTVEPEGILCDCGAKGCLEAYASASGLKRLLETQFFKKPKQIPDDLFENGHFSVSKPAARARSGDRIALQALATSGRYLGIAIASFINALNPEIVVIGGGIAGALPLMREQMMLQVRARAIAFSLRRTKIVRAALGESAGIVGAAYAAAFGANSGAAR